MLKKMSCVMVFLGLLFATTVQAKEVVSIATAMAGGAWYAAGGAIADIINQSCGRGYGNSPDHRWGGSQCETPGNKKGSAWYYH